MCQGGWMGDEPGNELIERRPFPFHFDFHAAGMVPHEAAELKVTGQAIDERPEPDSLYCPLDRDCSTFHEFLLDSFQETVISPHSFRQWQKYGVCANAGMG